MSTMHFVLVLKVTKLVISFQVMHCDNLSLPFKDETLDAALSVAVIHHIATAERRIRALEELARVLRVGGKVMIRQVTSREHFDIFFEI